jgi:putative membrane protein
LKRAGDHAVTTSPVTFTMVRQMLALLGNVVRGFLMGAADVVPGVSGGTVALVLGIYRRLISSVRDGSKVLGRLVKLDFSGARHSFVSVEWRLIAPLLIGILIAVATLSGVIEHLLENSPVQMAGLFLGLVAGSVVVAWGLLEVRDVRRWTVLVIVAIVTFVLLGARGGTSDDTVSQVADPALWAFFIAGAIAICAMILPGISGSFLLVTMGMYGPVLSAVSDRDLAIIVVFGLGCVIGLALFSQVLHWALVEHEPTVMAGLIGLMIGSIRVLWPWPSGLDSTELGWIEGPVLVPIGLMVLGFVVVVAIDLISARIAGRDHVDTSFLPQD